MSHPLPPPNCVARFALRRPSWHPRVPVGLVRTLIRGVILVSSLTSIGSACAHAPAKEPGAAATVDLTGVRGARSSLGAHRGQILVVELCASWSDPCLASAGAISEVCEVLCPRDNVHVVTILLDELGPEGLAAYEVMGLHQDVWLAGPRARAGESALGDLLTIPRVLIFDEEGALVSEQAGGIVRSADVIEEVFSLGG